MTASATSPGPESDQLLQRQLFRDVLDAIVHGAVTEPELALMVVEVGSAATRPLVRWVNGRASDLVGWAAPALEGERLAAVVVEPQGTALAEVFDKVRPRTTTMKLRTYVGDAVECRATTVPAPGGRLWTLHVRPAHSEAEVSLRAEAAALEERIGVLVDRSPAPTMMSEQGMRLARVNDALCVLLGVSADRLLGTGWITHVHPEDLERITDTVVSAIAGEQRDVRTRVVDGAGRLRYVDVRFTPLRTPSHGDGFVATVEDIAGRSAVPDPDSHRAARDPLTGLPRRGTLWEHMAAAMADPEAGLACLFIDLDNFRQVNESVGPKAGDALLVEVARRLAVAVGPGDLLGRFGGDEFVVACDTGSLDVALELAERILRVLADPVVLGGIEVRPRASIGVVLRGPDHHSADALIRDGDVAMYQAKARGKGRIVVLDEAARSEVLDTLTLVSDLRQAIERRAITVHYQPVVRLEGSRPQLVSVEALGRWFHRERGAVPPDVVARLAAEHGLEGELGRLVLETGCAAMADWRRELGALAPPQISVSMSARQLGDPLLVPLVKRTLLRHGLRPAQLALVVTGSAPMDDPGAATSLAQLLDHGVQVSHGPHPEDLTALAPLTDEDLVTWCRSGRPVAQEGAL